MPTEAIAPCNKKLIEEGKGVLYTSGNATTEEMEAWVRKVAAESQCSVDWYCLAGRDVVKCFGEDVERVREVCSSLLHELKRTLKQRKTSLQYKFL